MGTALTIGQLAKATGTKPETVRYYERIGLIRPPRRTSGNYRAYGGDALSRLGFIRRSRQLGFSIDQVRELLDLADRRMDDCRSVDAIASDHLTEIDRKLGDLAMLRRELSALMASCKGGMISECGILESLGPKGT